MKLRGRFTLTLALAALVPIGVAAFITRQVIAESYLEDYRARRSSAQTKLETEREQLRRQVDQIAARLAITLSALSTSSSRRLTSPSIAACALCRRLW